jgi:16S rRNA (guanine(527)-N(7))-methyltransferase RsmG
MKPDVLTGARTLLEKALPNVPRGTLEQILRYIGLTMTWNPSINLTGAKDPMIFLKRHVLDCVEAYRALPKVSAYMDIGSGAGLPGLIWAILDSSRNFILLEILKKRSAFLNRAVGELALSRVKVVNQSFAEIEETNLPETFDLVSRGTWPPDALLQTAAGARFRWSRWWVFSNEILHQQYLKLSPHYKIRAESLIYPKNEGVNGLLTRLDREK